MKIAEGGHDLNLPTTFYRLPQGVAEEAEGHNRDWVECPAGLANSTASTFDRMASNPVGA
jgi:hypothetical protein